MGTKASNAYTTFTVVCFSLSLFGLTRIGTEFLPPTDEGFTSISVNLEKVSLYQKQKRLLSKLRND